MAIRLAVGRHVNVTVLRHFNATGAKSGATQEPFYTNRGTNAVSTHSDGTHLSGESVGGSTELAGLGLN
jgi:hypothetical protein